VVIDLSSIFSKQLIAEVDVDCTRFGNSITNLYDCNLKVEIRVPFVDEYLVQLWIDDTGR
jgi:hypothetical protein